MMLELSEILLSSCPYILPLLLLLSINKYLSTTSKSCKPTDNKFPKSYPLIGHLIALYQNKDDPFHWFINLLLNSPTATIVTHHPFGWQSIETGNPANVEHILKTKFPIYPKGPYQKAVLQDLLGDGIFNADHEMWKFQRQVASHEFSTKSLRKFVETIVDDELSDRLIPILLEAAKKQTVIDLQDILQRFAFDNICKIAFGYDPEYLSPSLPQAKFAVAFEDAVMISSQRARAYFSGFWKFCRFLNIGSEKKLKQAIVEIREFANSIVRQKKQEKMENSEAEDLLSRFLKSGHSDEKFVTDIVISFILAGRDTTSAALTWFFWLLTDLVVNSPSSTFVLQRPFGRQSIVTGNPATVEHILKTRFPIYQKGPFQQAILRDLLGDGIFNADGEMWKFQRQVASLEFNTKSLRKFVETVVDTEISDRLIPLLSNAAKNRTVLDLQDILQRFAFDNICKIAFGYDPKYLLPSLPQAKFAVAFEDAVIISSQRFRTFFPIIWKTKRILNIGSEKRLKEVVSEIRDFAKSLVSQKKHEMEKDAGKSLSSELPDDLLSRPRQHIVCLNMVFLAPVPADTKEATADDVLPDGMRVKKGTWVTYHPYAMGRMKSIWGLDWAEYRPARWLDNTGGAGDGKWRFVPRDPYSYPVFQAGPRVCLGKEMSFLQMKRVAACILENFQVVPAVEEGFEPVYIPSLTAKMQGGFPVRFEHRAGTI